MSERGKNDLIEAMQGANKLLVTGIGRSGTQYMSRLLSLAGLPCGHEALYPTSVRRRPDWGDVMAESAWPAACWLPLEGTKVVHLVRDPLKWLASWSQTVWSPTQLSGSTTKYLTRHTGHAWRSVAEADPIEASMQLWVTWNNIAEAHADMRLRVEDVDAAAVGRIFELSGRQPPSDERIEQALAEVPTNANGRAHGVVFARDCLGKPSQKGFAAMAERYGYVIDWRGAPLTGGAGI